MVLDNNYYVFKQDSNEFLIYLLIVYRRIITLLDFDFLPHSRDFLIHTSLMEDNFIQQRQHFIYLVYANLVFGRVY